MEMVSFPVEEGWSNLRGFTGANPICDGGGGLYFVFWAKNSPLEGWQACLTGWIVFWHLPLCLP